MPGAPATVFCAVELKPPGPVQLNVVPVAVVLPIRLTEDVVQVSSPLAEAVTFGGAMLEVTVTLAVPVPAEFVPVTV